jgi:hypothetical protein
MGFLDKAKNMAGQAATKAKQEVEELQAKRELSSAYADLGKAAFELIESGELTHAGLDAAAANVRTARERVEAAEAEAETPPEAEPSAAAEQAPQ